jgi:Ca2+-binding EF-hand superfamily protein
LRNRLAAFQGGRVPLPVAAAWPSIGELTVTHRLLLTAFLTTVATAAAAQTTSTAAPTAQNITRTSFMQKVDNSFVLVDSNKDGFMERAEIESAEVKVLTTRKATLLRQREESFRKLDTNKDGSVSLQEFNAPLVAVAIPRGNATPVLSRLDTNKDGKVSLAENRTPAMAQFDRADSNKDGSLSPAEQKATARR